MKWGEVAGVTVIVALMAIYDWPKIKKGPKKEKAAFMTLSALGWLLAVLLLHFPDLPGPTQLVDAMFKPLGKLLEK